MKVKCRYEYLFCVLIALVCIASDIVAQTKSRMWTDATDRFEIEAELLKHDKNSVTLRKTDKRVITIPLAKLSEADRKFIQDLASRKEELDNPFAGGKIMAESGEKKAGPASTDDFQNDGDVVELSSTGPQIFLTVDEDMSPLPADGPAVPQKFVEFSCILESLDAYARVSSPVLVDPAGPVFAVSTHRNGNRVDPRCQSAGD